MPKGKAARSSGPEVESEVRGIRLNDDDRYDVQAVKDRLTAYRESDRDIENQTELLEKLIARLEGVGAQEITDMPKAPSQSYDRMSDLVSQKIELEEMIGEDIAALREERKYFEKILRKLKKADERAVIRFRYFMRMNWSDVTEALFGAKTDFLDKEDSYNRRVTQLHCQALLHIAMCIEEQKK